MKKTLLFCISLFTNLSVSSKQFLKNFILDRNTQFVSDLRFSKIYFKAIIIFVLLLNSNISNAQCGANAGTVNSNTAKLCVGSNESFSSDGWGGGTWSSSNPAVLEVTSNGGSATAVGKAPGTAFVIYTVSQASCPNKTSQKQITVYNALGATGEIAGINPQCTGANTQTYSVPAVANATTYLWSLPSGWAITSGDNTNSITVTVGSNSGNIGVTVSNDCRINAKKERFINVNPVITQTPVATNPSNIQCDYAMLNWSNVTNATGFYLDIAKDSGFTNFISGYNNYNVDYNNGSSPVYNLPGGTLYFRVRAYNTCTVTPNSNVVSFSTPAPLGGKVSSDQTICSGTSPNPLTLTEYTTSNTLITGWQKSNDASFSNPTAINNTTNTLSSAAIGNLTSSTYFRAVVQNQFGSSCLSYSSPALITINAAGPTFTIAPSGNVCVNTNVTYTTESGKSNYVWNIPGTAGTDYAIISGSTSSNSVVLQWKTAGSKTVTVNYSNGCSVTSAASNTVTVNTISVSAASSSPQVCINNALPSITHTVTGVSSINASTGFPTGVSALLSPDKSKVTISGTPSQSGIFDYNVTLVTACGNIAATGRITVNAASVGGTASSSQAICNDTQPANITLTGNTGTIQWQVSSDNNSFTNINGATSATLTSAQMGNLNAVHYYRALVTSGLCASTYSTVATVTIIITDRGRAKGGKHICPGNANPTLKLYTLNNDLDYPDATKVLRWEYSDNFNNATYTPIPGTAGLATYTPTETLLAFRTYRAVLKFGSCATEYSIETRVDVDAPTAITAQSTATQSKCIGNSFSPITVTATGTDTLTYQWYINNANSNTGGTSLNALNGARTNTYIPQSNTAGTVYYYCIVTGTCGTATSIVSGAFVTSPNPVAPTGSVTTQPTCIVNTGTIKFSTPTPATGITYSIDGTNYINTNGIFSGVAVGTYNLTTKNNSGCISPAIAVTVNAPAGKIWTGITSTDWNIATNWSPNGVPTSSDCVVIPDLTNIANKPIIPAANTSSSAYNLTVSNKASLVVASAGTLTIENGITVESSGSLTFENSASLLQTNTANNINTGKITYKRTSEQIRLSDFVYWSTPVSPQRLIDVSPLTSMDKFFAYNGTGWVSNNTNNNMIVGKGYIIRAPSNFSTTKKADYTASFIGVPNNGTLTGETVATGKFYLVGNPYPSAMDADKFLANNLFLDGTIYFWTHYTSVALVGAYRYSTTDYASYNMTGGVGGQPAISESKNGGDKTKPKGEIAAGQSFFVTAASNGTVTFNNDMRLGGTNNGQFFKSATTSKSGTLEKHRIWLNMTNAEGAFKQMLVGYIEGATNEYESRYDGVSFDANAYIDFYSVANGNNYVIQARALPFTDKDQVPLGYRTTIAGDFTISIDEVDGDLTSKDIYLEDKTTGTIHDLRAGNYTFTTAVGTFADRFVLRYASKTLGTGDFENVENGLLVSVKDKTIQILSSKEAISEVAIFDITGKAIYNKKKVGTTELQIQNLPSANEVLLVKVTLDNNFTATRKIIFN
jgi:hypothetical protein